LLNYYVLKGGWFDPGGFHSRLPSFLSPITDFLTISDIAINKVGFDKMRFMN